MPILPPTQAHEGIQGLIPHLPAERGVLDFEPAILRRQPTAPLLVVRRG